MNPWIAEDYAQGLPVAAAILVGYWLMSEGIVALAKRHHYRWEATRVSTVVHTVVPPAWFAAIVRLTAWLSPRLRKETQ